MRKALKYISSLALMISSGLMAFAGTTAQNPMVFGNNRLSIITPTLLRLEYANDAKFIDAPTLFAYDRTNMLSPEEISVRELGDNCYEIKTPALRIWYNQISMYFIRSTAKRRNSPTAFCLKTISEVPSRPSTASPKRSR